MPSYDEWDEAIRKGPVAKRKLLGKSIKDKRTRSKLPPEETERILSLYEKYSLENFRFSEQERNNLMKPKKNLMDELDEMDPLLGAFLFAVIVVGGAIVIIVAAGTVGMILVQGVAELIQIIIW